LIPEERDARFEALNAALTSWPRVEFVRMERRWRGLKAVDVEEGILQDVIDVFRVGDVMLLLDVGCGIQVRW
jgi:hypothetical protein